AVCGEPHPGREVLRSFIGPPLSESFRDELGMSAERAERMRLAYAEHYLDEGIKAAVPFPGMRALIGRLVEERRTVAVATNKPELAARRILAHQVLDTDHARIGGHDRASGRAEKSAD